MPPRPLRPKDDPATSEGSETPGDSKFSKRRAVSSACIPCRKRKSKCDGAVPSCSTCTAVYRTECQYDADSDHRRKGALKRDIQCLQQQNDALDVIVASLKSLPENDAVSLLHHIRADSSLDLIAAALRTNVRLPSSYAPQTLEADFAQQMSQATPTSIGPAEHISASPRKLSSDDGYRSSESPTTNEIPTGWFQQPQDAEFVEHLLNLFLSWVHPFYHFFSRELFLRDMGQGRSSYCSAMLVNAVLAMACHYSDRPGARSDPNNSMTAGDQYFAEAKRLLDRDGRSSLTTVQALGVMAVRECSHGRESSGYMYAGRCLRMALELGLHLSVIGSGMKASEMESRRITFWAVFNLETTCSVSFGRLSLLPRAAADIPKPAMSERLESTTWRPYVEDGVALSPSSEQPARPALFVDCLSRLSELASDMVNTFYAPQERFTSRRLAAAYNQYQEWYHNLPDAFRLENTTLPHVLVLHMYYHSCVLQLFRPYIKLDLRGAGLFPRDTCTFRANEISSLMNALRAMYGLRRVCHLVCSWIMSASTIHLLNLPQASAAANLSQGLHDLKTMSVNHLFAARCIDIIRALATKWNIALPEDAAAVSSFRLMRQWPSPPASDFFATTIPRKDSSGSGAKSGGSISSHQPETPFPPPLQQQQHSSLPLLQTQQNVPTFYTDPTAPMDADQAQHAFWTPFPAQGLPMSFSDISMDFNSPTTGSIHGISWPGYGGSAGPPTTQTSNAYVDSLLSTTTPGQNMGEARRWGWQ
ncbi:hypothetical protein LTR78_008260 [Recurvomyces mirabilis]|uniref:Zn(2)-C6 fungal-type domain-containing protein n=1 Tax=Recurvomyces mirabilis TaxID=574656 RepID=A0AAE0WHS5_9PEZI|nr:hypothetical protein LTR78_008260 [Recurvomyces mirabilis]KAK5156545.1 hypothetical protein LTS14_004757 [Recurvomyces mirabilis]